MQFAFLGQVFRCPDPVAGLASAGRLIVPQFAVQGFDEFDALTQRLAKGLRRFAIYASEVLEAFCPLTLSLPVTVMASLSGRRIKALVREISLLYEFLDQ
jgi:hypothetical protein